MTDPFGDWLVGDWTRLGAVAGKAALMYAAALLALRVGERRMLAQWTTTDFVAAVAIGAIIGRTAVASRQSFVVGAVAIATLVAVHRAASVLRFHRWGRKLSDHPVRVLVTHGRISGRQLRVCGLTESDLYAQLRRRGVFVRPVGRPLRPLRERRGADGRHRGRPGRARADAGERRSARVGRLVARRRGAAAERRSSVGARRPRDPRPAPLPRRGRSCHPEEV
ncbi:DUF421 domain-containing protein [Actinomadura sediminis]|uniref:DUF421 domain-containing protein n=1 Tax=Actinomadura sediminis TaxID=1038904 RepID=A0ABW3ELB4_9ACTN